MFEILTLHKNGNPETDWSVLAKRYVSKEYAQGKLQRLLDTGWYKAVILLDTSIQDRYDCINRMNELLRGGM